MEKQSSSGALYNLLCLDKIGHTYNKFTSIINYHRIHLRSVFMFDVYREDKKSFTNCILKLIDEVMRRNLKEETKRNMASCK